MAKVPQRDRIREARLPASGHFPFVPPGNWSPTQPLKRGPNGGYLDRLDREWVKGRSITPGQPFEWDVQIDGGRSHINVDLNGNISHPR